MKGEKFQLVFLLQTEHGGGRASVKEMIECQVFKKKKKKRWTYPIYLPDIQKDNAIFFKNGL